MSIIPLTKAARSARWSALRGRLRWIQIIFWTMGGMLLAAAIGGSVVIVQQQATLRSVDRYNATWIVTQATIDVARMNAVLAEYLAGGNRVSDDEVRLRLDLMLGQVQLLLAGDAGAFVRSDPQLRAFATELQATIHELDMLSQHFGQPDVPSRMLDLLLPFNADLQRVASAAYVSGSRAVSRDISSLTHMHWVLNGILTALITYGTILLLLLNRHNRLLTRAHRKVKDLVDQLRHNQHVLSLAHEQARQAVAETRQQNARFDAALNNMSHALCMVDAAGSLIVCNFRFLTLFQIPPAAAETGRPIAEIFGMAAEQGRYESAMIEAIWDAHRQLNEDQQRGSFVQEDTLGRALAISQQPMATGGWVATYEDISQRRQIEGRIAFMAHHDSLTGLPNRALFQERLQLAFAGLQAGRSGPIALFCLDLDRFKDVNDTLGHPTGDSLLRVVADRLLSCVRKTDLIARLGGDEFAILQVNAEQPDTACDLAERIVTELSASYNIDGQRIVISVSVGIAVAEPGDDPDILLKHGDIALYRAKSEGRSTYKLFRPEMASEERARRILDLELRDILGRNQLALYYQPIFDVRRNRLAGFEALLRWRHPEFGLIGPGKFIPIAEELGIIDALGRWVMQQACADALLWPDDLKIAVNLSPVQFRTSNVADIVTEIIESSGLRRDRVELEITESAILEPSANVFETLARLRETGLRLALDDFGVGYSSLSYLRLFSFDKVKLDQSFIRNLRAHPQSLLIVESVVTLCRRLGMDTTVEGVETFEEFTALQDVMPTELQGYYLGYPMPLPDVLSNLRKPSGWPFPSVTPTTRTDRTIVPPYRLSGATVEGVSH